MLCLRQSFWEFRFIFVYFFVATIFDEIFIFSRFNVSMRHSHSTESLLSKKLYINGLFSIEFICDLRDWIGRSIETIKREKKIKSIELLIVWMVFRVIGYDKKVIKQLFYFPHSPIQWTAKILIIDDVMTCLTVTQMMIIAITIIAVRVSWKCVVIHSR